ncbi:hypothetical protein RV14_GL002402 [Enterococcus ratti]|uniref:Uncharacterized protein n=1 Tax=Enterococcus ratti TaxID=150033 RepID=A0A1L8WLF2_9ENTE|nr:hypothetical protein RV14_GL002402 [Enterococcus ratti]
MAAKGSEVKNFEIGDRVYYAGTTKRSGSNQAFQLVDERIAAKVLIHLSDEACAALPLTALTTYELLFEKCQFIPNELGNIKKILVINGACTPSSILIHLVKWSGLEVVSTASPRNFDWLKQNGVDYPIDHHQKLKPQLEKAGIEIVNTVAVLHDIRPYLTQLIEIIQSLGENGMIIEGEEPINISKFKNLSAVIKLLEENKLHNILGKVYKEGITVET